MLCQLCRLDRPLINAHIIPTPFFTAQGTVGRAAKLLSNTAGEYPKRLLVGFYDDSILCAECDRSLGVWDQYGVELPCHGLRQFLPIPAEGPPVAFGLPTFDYRRLRLFILSVLWRAGVSSLPVFKRVTLGPYAEVLRGLLVSGDPGGPDDFSVLLSAFTVDGAMPSDGAPIMDPFRERWDRVNSYRLSFGVVTAYAKVDRAQFSKSFRRLALRPNEPLFLLARDFQTSPEAAVARAIVVAPTNRNAFRRRT